MNNDALHTIGQFQMYKGYQVFHLNDSSLFSSLQYKVIKNEDLNYIIPCRKITKDYDAELIFITKTYRDFGESLLYMTVPKCIKAINDFINVLLDVEKKDYLDISNIVLEEKNVLYDLNKQKIRLIYMPISFDREYHSFYIELIRYLKVISEKTKLSGENRWKDFLHDMDKKEYTLQEVSFSLKSLLTDNIYQDYSDIEERQNNRTHKYVLLKGLGKNNKNIFHIEMEKYIIGRIPSLVEGSLPMFPTVSSKHCMLTKCEDGYVISDLSSVNGTFVNHVRLKQGEKRKLQDGDIVNIAELSFTVEIKEQT